LDASSSSLDASSLQHDMHEDTVARLHPEHSEYSACKYSGEWGDCDPFKMIKIKEERLLTGGAACQERKNITKPCSREDFPPGTIWLLKEHKLCVLELQKLKSMIEDLHRYIDLIHQRGQALFNSYNELRKRLMDVRREISILGRRNHDAEQTVTRLRVEMDDWKTKSNKMQMELNELKAQYKEMENKVEAAREEGAVLAATREELANTQTRLAGRLEELSTDNRNLKSSLLEADRYREEYREVAEIYALIKRKKAEVSAEIKRTKEELNKARMEGAVPKAHHYAPKFNKDTKVNLDMSMWITHNYTKEEQEEYAPKLQLQPYVAPKYEAPKYEAPKYEPPKYEPPKYEPPKYEPPKYEPPKYEEPTTEVYEESTTYEPVTYEETTTEDLKYEAPKYEEPESSEEKYR